MKGSNIRKLLVDIFKIVLPLSVGILLLYWLYSGMNWDELVSVFKGDVCWGWVLGVVALCFVGHIIRTLRWSMLTNTVAHNIPFMTLFNAVLLNYGVNLVIPRMGEVSRCVAVSKHEKLPFSTLFGTLLSERTIDALTVFVLTIITVYLQFDYFAKNLVDIEHIVDPFIAIFRSPFFYVGAMLCVGVVFYFFYFHKENRIVTKVRLFIVNIWAGFMAIKNLKNGWRFFLLTIALWTVYLLQLYLCFFIFDFTLHLPFIAAVVAFVMGSLAYGLPVQGAFGPWHFGVILTLSFYGVEREQAAAFALVAHTVPTLVMAFGGLFASFWFSKY